MERVFSGTKELITNRRNALDMESIQANECLGTGVQHHKMAEIGRFGGQDYHPDGDHPILNTMLT